MLYELCAFTGMIVLGAFIFIMLMNIYVGITNKIKERKQIITLDQYDNITYNGIEYKIMSKKIKVRRIEHKPLKTIINKLNQAGIIDYEYEITCPACKETSYIIIEKSKGFKTCDTCKTIYPLELNKNLFPNMFRNKIES